MSLAVLHVYVGWVAALFGVLAGGAIGLFFHRETWAGGYGSFRRRMLRLGHISFFGIGFLNLFLGLSLPALGLTPFREHVASAGLLAAVFLMPAACFLAAWKEPLRHLFPLPVLAVLSAIVAIVAGPFLP